jgi:2-phospho-L-lactate guanylyltransferase
MSLWAIVPVKPLRQGKSRLSKVLTEDQRTSLNQRMLKRTLEILAQVKEVDQVLVVSKDPNALALARDFKAKTLQENGQPGLNTALEKATVVAMAYKARSILILPADLPILRPEDVKSFINYSTEYPEVIIAPDRRNEGTNALIVKPTGAIQYHFGADSYQKHLEEAKLKKIPIKTCDIESIELDLDLPEDLEYLRSIKSAIDFEPF